MTAGIAKFTGATIALNTIMKGISLGFSQVVQHSANFNKSLENIKSTTAEAIAPKFEKIGDSLAGIVGNLLVGINTLSNLPEDSDSTMVRFIMSLQKKSKR